VVETIVAPLEARRKFLYRETASPDRESQCAALAGEVAQWERVAS
jgi:hypothetical protein